MARSVATYMPHCGSWSLHAALWVLDHVSFDCAVGLCRACRRSGSALVAYGEKPGDQTSHQQHQPGASPGRINRSRKRSSRISQVIVQERSSCWCFLAFSSCFLISSLCGDSETTTLVAAQRPFPGFDCESKVARWRSRRFRGVTIIGTKAYAKGQQMSGAKVCRRIESAIWPKSVPGLGTGMRGIVPSSS